MRDRERHDHFEAHRALLDEAEVLVDARLSEEWQLLWSLGTDAVDGAVTWKWVGAMMRLAYVQGYSDARTEETPGKLFAELGIRDPLSLPD